MTNFKVGDRVRLLGTKSYGNPFNYTTYNYGVGDIYTINYLYSDGSVSFKDDSNNGVFRPEDIALVTVELSNEFKSMFGVAPDFKIDKGEKMELKDISKKNLGEALKQVQEEKASAEIKYAKEVLRANLDRKDTLTREIKVRQEEIDKIEEAIKLFK
jgi:hypothetical protein